jgi:FtsZ-binding cell division protein ZapB
MLVAGAANAAPPGPRDPDWPCQQIKVPALSLASVWSGPSLDPQHLDWRDDPQVADLVSKLTPRRQALDQAGAMIHEFARQAGDQKSTRMLKLLAGFYTVLDSERNSILAGLDRFGGRQKELATELRSDNEKLQALQSGAAPDQDAIRQLTQKVAWEAEVFQDRRQAILYACDAPGKIEQRLFALARLVQQQIE